MQDTLERVIATAKAAMLNNIKNDPEWERHTKVSAHNALQLLNDALAATVEELFPEGVPANEQMKGRHWNSKNRELTKLIGKRGEMMRQLRCGKDEGATAAQLEKEVQRKQRQIRENTRTGRRLPNDWRRRMRVRT